MRNFAIIALRPFWFGTRSVEAGEVVSLLPLEAATAIGASRARLADDDDLPALLAAIAEHNQHVARTFRDPLPPNPNTAWRH